MSTTEPTQPTTEQPPQKNSREKQAESWFYACFFLMGALAFIAFLAMGTAFETTEIGLVEETTFNGTSALAGAAAAIVAWLPAIAVLDCLRRGAEVTP